MGKFDDVLFFSDYDDTLYSHHLEVSAENKAAIRYFIQEGGRFSIATGRAHRTFTPQIAKEGLEFNAPVVLSNGAAIYDYSQDRYLVRTQLGGGNAGAGGAAVRASSQTWPLRPISGRRSTSITPTWSP